MVESGLTMYACTEKTDTLISDCDFEGPIAIVMGAEDKGITPRILKTADHLAVLPLSGKIASLNVSVSVGMALMEARRQRDFLNT